VLVPSVEALLAGSSDREHTAASTYAQFEVRSCKSAAALRQVVVL
jgi:hypothetical protein